MSKTKKTEELTNDSFKTAISKTVKEKKSAFNLDSFKKNKNLSKNASFKKQEWIPLSPAFQDALSLPGLPHGHIIMLRGHSDTGKSTAMLEAAISAQKMGKLPVLIVTEMKFSWTHAKIMGFEFEEVVDTETGEINYVGNFIYVDGDSIQTIEDVASFMADLLDEQAKGHLPYDLVFLWDSVGSIPCRQTVESKKNNNEWNASAVSTQFGNYINQKITRSRKESSPYTNSFIVVNKIWVAKPTVHGEMPKMQNKNGTTFFYDASLVVTFGNVTNAGTSKIKATKNGRDVEFAKRTKIAVDKNHITGITTSARIIATPHGFIRDNSSDLEKYKKVHRHEWLTILGTDDFDVVEENDMKEDLRDVSPESQEPDDE